MSKTTAIVFFGIIVIGIFVSVFTLTNRDQPEASTSTNSAPAQESSSSAKKPAPEATTPKITKAMKATEDKPLSSKPVVETKPAAQAKPARPTGGFTSEKALMNALAKAIKDKNLEQLFELTGPTALSASARARLAELLKKGNLKLDLKQPLSAIGRTKNSTRWALRLTSPTNEVIEIFTDLSKDPKLGWEVLKMRAPGTNIKMSAAASTNGNAPSTGPSSAANEAPDAMMVAYAFSKAVISRDIKTARSLTNPDILKGEKLAALLIALEEGNFRLKADKPLVITLSRDDLTWAITRVESNDTKSDFGLEMNLNQKGQWSISGLTFSKLISMTAAAAGAGNVAYSPMRKNPKGGESLVLYFEFDNEKVSARTRKQLMIVADILSQQSDRKIHINGHADAKGEDGYNISLSKRRTDAVRNTLIELGVTPSQIVTKAFGETMPLKPNFNADGTDNPTGRAQNRRTEIYLDF